MAKSALKYGEKDLLSQGELDPKKAKVRISLFVDGDVLMAFKEAAKATSHGEYQKLMRESLREKIFGRDPASVDARLEALERMMASLGRIKAVARAIKSKKGSGRKEGAA